MPFRFTGDVALLYTQYRDLDADRPLFAEPGQSYDMAPVGGWNLTVPPSDGRWDPPPVPPERDEGDDDEGAGDDDGSLAAGTPARPPLLSAPSDEDNEG
jgi:hypothetical protein